MAKMTRLAGSTSNILTLFVQDSSSTTGAGLAGLAFGTSGLTCYYKRNTGSASVAVTLVTITTLGTYASGGFKEVDATNLPGFYEFHPPDAAYASGAKSVAFLLKGATNMAPMPVEVELTAVDNQAASYGLSLAKTTNITGLNDIAATAIVSGGAITTSGGAVSTVTTTATATNLTNLPSVPTDWLTGAGVNATAVTKFQAGLSTYAGADTSGTTTLLSRVTGAVALASQIPANFTTATFASAGVFATAALANAPTGGGGADTSGTTTLLTRLTGPRATLLDNLDAAVSTRSTYAGGAVASVTAAVTATIADKTGFSLADASITSAKFSTSTVNASATGLLEKLLLLFQRFYPVAGGSVTAPRDGNGSIVVKGAAGATISTQAVTDDGTTQVLGEAS